MTDRRRAAETRDDSAADDDMEMEPIEPPANDTIPYRYYVPSKGRREPSQQVRIINPRKLKRSTSEGDQSPAEDAQVASRLNAHRSSRVSTEPEVLISGNRRSSLPREASADLADSSDLEPDFDFQVDNADGHPPAPYLSRHHRTQHSEKNGPRASASEVYRFDGPADVEADPIDVEENENWENSDITVPTRGGQEIALDDLTASETPDQVPATDTGDVESGCEGRLRHAKEILERLKQRRRFLIIFPIVLVAIVVFMATFPVSFHYIHYYDIALKRSKWTGWVDFTQTYRSGCYVTWPDMEFIHFNSTSRVLDLDLSVTSSSSLSYKLRLITVYRIDPDQLPQLYRKFAGEHEEVIIRTIKTTAKNRAVSIHVDSWLHHRRAMERELEAVVAARLNSSYHVHVSNVFLVGISFPEKLLARLMRQEELKLKSETAEHNLHVRVEQMKTKQATTDLDNRANEVAEEAMAVGGLRRRIATATGRLRITADLGDGLLGLRNLTQLNDNGHLMSAFWLTKLRTMAQTNRLLVAQKVNVTRSLHTAGDGSGFVDSLVMAAAATVRSGP